MQSIMAVECAWCRKIVSSKDGEGQTGMTSGICSDCVDKHFPDQAEEWHRRHDAFALEAA